MTTDAAPDGTLRYVREELAELRTSVRQDVTALRAAVDTMAAEFRAATVAQAPRLAVLERRADDAAADINDLHAQVTATATRVSDLERRCHGFERQLADQAAVIATAIRNRSTLTITLAVGLIIAVVSAVLAWVLPA